MRTTLLCIVVCGVAAGALGGEAAAKARLLDVRKIWDRAPHNAFTDLIRFRGRWLCVFREGGGHVSHDGKVRVLASKDGKDWTSAALLTTPSAAVPDLRDPKITTMGDGRLLMTAAAANRQAGAKALRTYAWTSADGKEWGQPAPIGDAGFWLWRVTWHKEWGYTVGYDRRTTRLYRTRDGRRFETLVEKLFDKGYPNESSLLFQADGTCRCLLRRDGRPNTAMLGTARPPYKQWTWQSLGKRIGGPRLIELPDGRLLAGGRRYDGGARTSLMWLDAKAPSLRELLRLPSGGDTSYPGLVMHEGALWVSYYSSHEGKARIYLARVKLPAPQP